VTVDALEYLRAEDPVPHGSTAPPMEQVLARIESTGARPGRRWSGRARSGPWARALVPTLAVAATLAVVAAVVVIAVTHRGHAPAQVSPATPTAPAARSVPSPQSLMPRGGMRGRLLILGAASAAPDRALISFGQGHGTSQDWRASTTDGGASWHVAQTSWNFDYVALAGTDGWAEGLQSGGHSEGGTISFFATHDGGRTWHVAPSADPAEGSGGVSIAGGEVWALGSHCARPCTGPNAPPVNAVLRAPASADHLAATAGQPPLGDTTNLSVAASSRDEAYVLADDYGTIGNVFTVVRTRVFATHDGGRTWRSLPPPCPRLSFGHLYSAGADALWAACDPMHGDTALRRATAGGSTWAALPAKLGRVQLQPASAQVAWAVVSGGRVLRTSDGGRTWSQVWYGGRPEPTVLAGNTPVLTVQSPTTATVIAVVTRGRVDGHAARTNFVTYRTTDGGRTWRPSVVRLPLG
jgi:photosystem II stability/assembly factor-like uncharacterized protein